MKQLVCISKTPETTVQVKLTSDGSQLDTSNINYIINPYDEWYALVRAIELKEKVGGTVTVINVGDSSNDVIIRKALAIGADDAIRVDQEPQNAVTVAKAIHANISDANYDIIYCGSESIDYNGSQVGAMLSELMQLPYIPGAVNMEAEGTTATIKRAIAGGSETITVDKPFVLSASKGLAEQRIPNMRGIMMSKRKPINVVTAIEPDNSCQTYKYELPDGKSEVKMIDPDNMDELVRLLQEEAKVL